MRYLSVSWANRCRAIHSCRATFEFGAEVALVPEMSDVLLREIPKVVDSRCKKSSSELIDGVESSSGQLVHTVGQGPGS